MHSVSIAMATFNGQKYIQRQLDSLAAQTQIPEELVISDDGSTDNTLKIVETFARTAPFPVNIYRNDDTLGFRKNFMHAASLCRSELISFCDQDDCWYPDKISAAAAPFSDPEVLLTYHNADIVNNENQKIALLIEHRPKDLLVTPPLSNPWSYALGFTQVFRRSLLLFSDLWPRSLNHNYKNQPMAHDQWFFFLASVFGKVAYIDKSLVAYVQHGKNTYGWRRKDLKTAVTRHFYNHSDRYYSVAKAADSRANVLECATDKLEGVWLKRATVARERYRKLARHYKRRANLYTSDQISQRLKSFYEILVEGGYARGGWTLGQKSILTDICVGIPIGHLLPRVGMPS